MRDIRVSFPRPCDEKWEMMTPAGCDRICGRCDRRIHDLSNYELDEAVALLRRDPGTCVRARVGADGAVALKRGRNARRMVIAAAVTAGLLADGEPALAKDERPKGAIVGKVETYAARVRLFARDQAGATFRGKVGVSGRFSLKHLPPGAYSLTFVPDCGAKWTVDNIVVNEDETIITNLQSPSPCIVIGLLRIENPNG